MKTFEGWYCAHCQRGVDASEVTFHEQHTVCGRTITDDTPLVDGPVAWLVDYGDGSDPEVYVGERPPGVAAECSMATLYPESVKAERDAARAAKNLAVTLFKSVKRERNALRAENAELRERVKELESVFRKMIGIPASIGICEPLEGYSQRPSDALHAMEVMAKRIAAMQEGE